MTDNIRPMRPEDKPILMEMMRTFYASPAVHSNGSEEIFSNDIDACLGDTPYLEGYIIASGNTIQGYSMVAKSFATEFGKHCIWIEDLYIREQYRNTGLGPEFLEFITQKYPGCVFRLEVEEENEHAVNVYKKQGFTFLPYKEMVK